jgi:hypothetical protein
MVSTRRIMRPRTPRRPEPNPNESGFSWDPEHVSEYFHSPSEFTATRSDSLRQANERIDAQMADAYADLPGTRSGLVAATSGAGLAAVTLIVLESFWALLPGILFLAFAVVWRWATILRSATPLRPHDPPLVRPDDPPPGSNGSGGH